MLNEASSPRLGLRHLWTPEEVFRVGMVGLLAIDLLLRLRDWDILYQVGDPAEPAWYSFIGLLSSTGASDPLQKLLIIALCVTSYTLLLFPLIGQRLTYLVAALTTFLLYSSAGYAVSIQDYVASGALLLMAGGLSRSTPQRLHLWGMVSWILIVSLMYLTAAFAKIADPAWASGVGLTNVLSLAYASWRLSPLLFSAELPHSFWWLLNYGIIFFEASLGLLVLLPVAWLRRALVILGVLFHLGLELFMDVGLLGLFMCLLWIPLWSPSTFCGRQRENPCRWQIPLCISVCLYGAATALAPLGGSSAHGFNRTLRSVFDLRHPPYLYFGMYTGWEAASIHHRPVGILGADYSTPRYTIKSGTRIYLEDLLLGTVTAIPVGPPSAFTLSQLQGGRASFWQRLFISQFFYHPKFMEFVLRRFPAAPPVLGLSEKYYSYPLPPYRETRE